MLEEREQVLGGVVLGLRGGVVVGQQQAAPLVPCRHTRLGGTQLGGHEVWVYLEPYVRGEAAKLAQGLCPLLQVVPAVYLEAEAVGGHLGIG